MALDEALGGWEVSSTFIAQSGNPFDVNTGSNNTSGNLSGNNTQEAILTGKDKTAGSSGAYHSLTSWFNSTYDSGAPGSAVWANPSDYTNQFGTFRRNKISGHDFTDVNFSLGKSFNILPEKGIKFKFRAEAANILNHPSFAEPGNNQSGNPAPESINSVTTGGREWEMVGHITF